MVERDAFAEEALQQPSDRQEPEMTIHKGAVASIILDFLHGYLASKINNDT